MTTATSSQRFVWAAFVALFVVAAALNAYGLLRPATKSYLWHDFDTAAIARNYSREGMNFLYPRIDWRGDGPGFAETEFPILPWTTAVLYRVFGEHEFIGRMLTFAASLLSLAAMFKLALYFFKPVPALVALAFFAFHPLVVGNSTSLQPETWMLLFYVACVYAFLRWVDLRTWRACIVASALTGMAILAKAPAAHIGLFMAVVVLTKFGPRALKDPMVWGYALGALLPALLWYLHARGLYAAYGNSLGISDESHWASWDLFTDPYFVKGIARHELGVWGKSGIVVAIAAVAVGSKTNAVKMGLAWYAAILAFYLLAARTTADAWATHYHIVSVPVAALFLAAGFDAVRTVRLTWPTPRLLGVTSAAFALVAIVIAVSGDPRLQSLRVSEIAAGLALSALLLVPLSSARVGEVLSAENRGAGVKRVVVACGVILALAGAFMSTTKGTLWWLSDQLIEDELHVCAREMAPALRREGLIVASGANELDHTGLPVAFNASYMFYWLDRKGFVVSREAQSIERLKEYVGRGAHYFVAEKDAIAAKPGFESELRKTFRLVTECSVALTFDLRASP